LICSIVLYKSYSTKEDTIAQLTEEHSLVSWFSSTAFLFLVQCRSNENSEIFLIFSQLHQVLWHMLMHIINNNIFHNICMTATEGIE